jgi:hypothetical protein
MKSIAIISFLLLVGGYGFGQRPQFFINGSIIDFQTEECWPLTKINNASPFKNYDFYIQKIEIENTNINLYISYGGGCGPVHLKLYVDNSYSLKNESIIRLYPEFLDRDNCKAIVSHKVCFDLSLLLEGRTKNLLIQIGKHDKIITVNELR